MGAYLILYPRARIRTLVFFFFLITFVDIPAFIFLIVWFIFQFANIGGSGIAWLAHVGGFIIGILLIRKKNKKEPVLEIVQ
jgi:membrane associated rhomboid family serine protease